MISIDYGQRRTIFDATFNFFLTAEHMLDWTLPAASKKERASEREAEILLRVVSHIANGLKHFHLDQARHSSVAGVAGRQGAFQPNAFQGDAFDTGRFLVRFEGEAAQRFGAVVDATNLAQMVLGYWRSRLTSTTDPAST